jgi:hypothetical protein
MKIEDITVVDLNKDDSGSSYLGLQTYLKRYKKVEPLKLGDKAYIGSELVKLNEPPGWVAKFFVWQGKKERSTQKARETRTEDICLRCIRYVRQMGS